MCRFQNGSRGPITLEIKTSGTNCVCVSRVTCVRVDGKKAVERSWNFITRCGTCTYEV